ncbi:MAG: hypothetical protein J0H37_04990 [Hyphomicrobium denitrificans]|nr:hypothetical protein [Hyphomicrobium denitrificans]
MLPILYNARHGVELALKFAIGELHQMGVIAQPPPRDHDISSAYEVLAKARLGDEALRGHVGSLASYIKSLSSIDDDGQMLRYSETQDCRKSLADCSLVNIAVVHTSLEKLSEALFALKERIGDFGQERITGTYLADCSRCDLFEIARMLPPRDKWKETVLDEVKAKVKARFGIGSAALTEALNKIQAHREMGAAIGLSYQLAHITDEHAKLVIKEWLKRHPSRKENGDGLGLDPFSMRDIKAWDESRRIERRVNEAVRKALSDEEIVDLEVIFYLGRDRQPTEFYESSLARVLRKHSLNAEPLVAINHLMSKTNFLGCFAKGVDRLGRPDLARELTALQA